MLCQTVVSVWGICTNFTKIVYNKIGRLAIYSVILPSRMRMPAQTCFTQGVFIVKRQEALTEFCIAPQRQWHEEKYEDLAHKRGACLDMRTNVTKIAQAVCRAKQEVFGKHHFIPNSTSVS